MAERVELEEFEYGSPEQIELDQEREEEAELIVERILHPEYFQSEEPSGKQKTKRALREEALRRLEEAARTEAEFEEVIRLWDHRDANRERMIRYHEVGRGDLPLEYGAAEEAVMFPKQYNNHYHRMLSEGEFLDIIFDCPYQIHELVTDQTVAKALENLKPDYKEILIYRLVRYYSTYEIALVRGQTDRNIRKQYKMALRKIREQIPELADKIEELEQTDDQVFKKHKSRVGQVQQIRNQGEFGRNQICDSRPRSKTGDHRSAG